MRILKASSFIEKLVDADLKLKRLVELNNREFDYEHDTEAEGASLNEDDFYVDLHVTVIKAEEARSELRRMRRERMSYYGCFGGRVIVSKSDVDLINRVIQVASDRHDYFSQYLVGSEGDNAEAEDGDCC
jgi:hypothetical protein